MTWLDHLREPSITGCDLDGEHRLEVHRAVLERKPMIRKVFVEFHHLFCALETRYLEGTGPRVELGAGVAPVRNSYPDVLSTDVVFGRHLDCVMDAQRMAFADGSVKAIFGQNCFHHFPDPELFFGELWRVLVNGGGAILIEPYHGPVASFLYKRLFTTEGFDKNFPGWKVPAQGPMKGANQALSYIVFRRDRERFAKLYPELKIVHSAPVGNYLRYLFSGGLNFRQLLPTACTGLLKCIEWALTGLNRLLAVHHVIVLRKEYTTAQGREMAALKGGSC